MKRTSLVLLIIAGILLIAGIIMCLYASNLAKKSGDTLYDATTEVREADGARIYDFTSKDVTRIKVAMNDADIRIFKSETDKSYVELFNFSTGTFDIGESNRLLTVTNKSGLSVFFDGNKKDKFSFENFSFKGLRYYLRFTSAKSGQPRVDIYLAEKTSVKIIDITSDSGKILLRDQSLSCDYDIDSNGGEVTLENVRSDSTLSLAVHDSNAVMKDTAISSCDVTVTNGNLTGQKVNVGVMTGNVTGGDIDIAVLGKIPEYRYFLKSPAGVVTVDKKEIGKRSSTDKGFGYLQMINESGSITLTSGEVAKDALGIKIDEKLITETIKKLDDSLGKNEYE